MTPLSLLLIMLDCSRLMDRYRLSQLGLVILHDRYQHNSNLNKCVTIEELEQADVELLNFEMMFRNIPFTAETTREAKIRLIIQ